MARLRSDFTAQRRNHSQEWNCSEAVPWICLWNMKDFSSVSGQASESYVKNESSVSSHLNVKSGGFTWLEIGYSLTIMCKKTRICIVTFAFTDSKHLNRQGFGSILSFVYGSWKIYIFTCCVVFRKISIMMVSDASFHLCAKCQRLESLLKLRILPWMWHSKISIEAKWCEPRGSRQ